MLKINEIFGPTIQGEGKSVGKEVIFIRTSLCNLYCIWCDTPYTWRWEDKIFEYFEKNHPLHEISPGDQKREKEIHDMSIDQVLLEIKNLNTSCKSIVLSGGEPLVQHKKLTPLLKSLKELGYWVEVETNGTIFPNEEFLNLVDQINCSPKLENSGNLQKDRENENVLRQLAKNSKTNFKFVVSSDKDVFEILRLVNTYEMKEVYLMPLGMTKEQLALTTETTKKLCSKWGFNFSDRLHVTKLGGGRGV